MSWYTFLTTRFTASLLHPRRRKKKLVRNQNDVSDSTSPQMQIAQAEVPLRRPPAYHVPSAIVAATERGMISASLCRMRTEERDVLTRGEEAVCTEGMAEGRSVKFKGVDV